MPDQNRQSDPKRTPGSMSGLVIAAIGLQLLLCSVTSAASSTIDRIPSSVAHALRDIVERHHAAADRPIKNYEPGYRLNDCPLDESASPSTQSISPTAQIAGHWLLNLPPPAQG
jgi:hypothetical protein